MTTSSTSDNRRVLAVRQRQYAIGVKDAVDELVSKNFTSCVGLIGTHAEADAAFIAHFDLFLCTAAVHDLARELERHGLDPSQFKLYTVRGYHVSLLFSCFFVWLIGSIFDAWFPQWAGAIALLFWGATPCFLSMQLRRCAGFRNQRPESLRKSKPCKQLMGFFGYSHVSVKLGDDRPRAWRSSKQEEYERFNARRTWWDWGLLHAGSSDAEIDAH